MFTLHNDITVIVVWVSDQQFVGTWKPDKYSFPNIVCGEVVHAVGHMDELKIGKSIFICMVYLVHTFYFQEFTLFSSCTD